MFRNEMFGTDERCFDKEMVDMNNTHMDINNVDVDINNYNQPAPMGGCGCKPAPVVECPVEKCVHREIVHEVPQV